MSKRSYLVTIDDEHDNHDGVLFHIADLGSNETVQIQSAEVEYGRQHRGMGAEVLPVGTSKPNPRSEVFKRLVGPWSSIGPEEWSDL